MQPGEANPQNDNELKALLSNIQQRLCAIEFKLSEKGAEKQANDGTENSDSAVQTTEHSNSESIDADAGISHTETEKTEEPVIIDIQKEFSAVRDAVSRVQLDPSLKLCEGPCPTGNNNKTERSLYYQLQKSSRYVETELKILQ